MTRWPLLCLLPVALSTALATPAPAEAPRVREFDFTYRAEIKDLPQTAQQNRRQVEGSRRPGHDVVVPIPSAPSSPYGERSGAAASFSILAS